jgi:hypothetical protein
MTLAMGVWMAAVQTALLEFGETVSWSRAVTASDIAIDTTWATIGIVAMS